MKRNSVTMWVLALICLVCVVAFTTTPSNAFSSQPFSWITEKIQNNPFVDVVDASTLTKLKLLEEMNLNSIAQRNQPTRPLLIKNLFSPLNREEWIRSMKQKLKNEKIEYEAKRVFDDNSIDVYECKFSEYMELIESGQSDHEDALYFMNEQILHTYSELTQPLTLPVSLFEKNQFDLFPPILRPKNALIIGGAGAKSFLHVDPYEWIGTNFLLKGKKLCKLLTQPKMPPLQCLTVILFKLLGIFISDKVPRSVFQGYPMIPDAWEMKKYAIATGYVSDVNLFQYPLPVSIGQSSKLSDKQLNHALNDFRKSSLPDINDNDFLFITSLSSILREKMKEKPTENQRYKDLPLFLASGLEEDEDDTEDGEGEGEGASEGFPEMTPELLKLLAENVFIAVQEEGELITIPSGYWHQVYHLEPSIAVASQFVNSWNQERVFDHMIAHAIHESKIPQSDEDLTPIQDWIDETYESKEFEELSSSERIQQIIQLVLLIQYGSEEGGRYYSELFPVEGRIEN